MVAGKQNAAAAAAPAGKLVDPGNGIFVGGVGGLGDVEKLAHIAEARRRFGHIQRGNTHQPDRRGEDEARQAHAPDRRGKQPRLLAGGAAIDAPVGAQQLEGLHVATERTAPVMVLAMDVVGDGAAERHELCSGNDGGKKAEGRGVVDDVAEHHARVGRQNARGGVEGMDARAAAHVHHGAGAVLAGIAVGAPIADAQHGARCDPTALQQRDGVIAGDHARGGRRGAAEAGKRAAGHRMPPATSNSAPIAITIWLRQSRMMKTTGSSCISSRRPRIQMRIVR